MIIFKKIFNFWHILKARIVVGYAFLSVLADCADINYIDFHNLRRTLIKDVLFFIRHPLTKRKLTPLYAQIKEAYRVLYRGFFRKYIEHRKTRLADYVYVNIECPALGSYFSRVIGVAWLCDKLNINVKFIFPDTYVAGSTNFFENPVLGYSKTCHPQNFTQLKEPLVNLDYWNEQTQPSIWEIFAKCKISSEYGYKIISQLSIKKDIQQQADQWYDANKKRECIGIHYRQTDVVHEARIIKIEDYIAYLKQVLDNRYDIFACSDNVQFIDMMHKEFPGKVISRDITRSNDFRSLHRHEPFASHQQRQDALIDILVLAKTKIIYTVGSFFVDIVRFFNPSIKIVSIDGRDREIYQDIPNYLPVPKDELLWEPREQTAWKKPMLDKKIDHIEFKRR